MKKIAYKTKLRSKATNRLSNNVKGKMKKKSRINILQEKMKTKQGRPPPPLLQKYKIIRTGKKLRIMNILKSSSKGNPGRISRTATTNTHNKQSSSTGNLGRTRSERDNKMNTDHSSSKGNLGRMCFSLADEKMELVVWHLRKKGILVE